MSQRRRRSSADSGKVSYGDSASARSSRSASPNIPPSPVETVRTLRPLLPSHKRSMVGQSQVSYDRATGALTATSSSAPAAPSVTSSAPITPAAAAQAAASAPSTSSAQPVVNPVATPIVAPSASAEGGDDELGGDPQPRRAGPGRPRSTNAAGKKQKGVLRVQSTSSLADDSTARKDPAKGTIAWGVQRLEQAKSSMEGAMDAMRDRIEDSQAATASVRMEIRALSERIQGFEREISALRQDRQDVFDTGSESEYSVVRETGAKRKTRSPNPRARSAKRSRHIHSRYATATRIHSRYASVSGSDSESDGLPPAPGPQSNPLPSNPLSLEQRISIRKDLLWQYPSIAPKLDLIRRNIFH